MLFKDFANRNGLQCIGLVTFLLLIISSQFASSKSIQKSKSKQIETSCQLEPKLNLMSSKTSYNLIGNKQNFNDYEMKGTLYFYYAFDMFLFYLLICEKKRLQANRILAFVATRPTISG